MNPNKSNRMMPLLMALCVIIGIIIGTFYANHFSGNRLNIINSGSNRLNNLLHIIDDQYVDAVNIDSLVRQRPYLRFCLTSTPTLSTSVRRTYSRPPTTERLVLGRGH